MTDRERFEDYKRKQSPCVRLARQSEATGGAYRTISVQRDWELWQASRKQALEEASSLCFRHALAWADTTLGNPSHKDMARGAQSCMRSIDALATPEGEQG